MGKIETTLDLEQARGGDPAAIEALCTRFKPRILRFIERRFGANVRRWVEPEDILQVVLLEIVHNLRSAQAGVTEDELLRRAFRIARSRTIDAVRRHRDRVGQSQAPKTPSGCGAPIVSEGIVTSTDEIRWLCEFVSVLPEKYRAVVEGIALQHMTRDEVAEELGLSPDTVQKRYERARDMLRARQSERGR